MDFIFNKKTIFLPILFLGFLFLFNTKEVYSYCPISSNVDLTIGSYSPYVKELQRFLNKNGFLLTEKGPGSIGNETSYFGPLTKNALFRYQSFNKIKNTNGEFEIETRKYLGCEFNESSSGYFKENLMVGSYSPYVKELQRFLNKNGFLLAEKGPGSIGNETSYFGPLTKNALFRYQIFNNFAVANGFLDDITRNHINLYYNNFNYGHKFLTSGIIIRNNNEEVIDSFNLIYSAGTNGSLTGDTSQTVNEGENGTAVTAIPDSGYHFVDWSDGLTSNPRTDLNVVENISVMANFVKDIPIEYYDWRWQPEDSYGDTIITTALFNKVDSGSLIINPLDTKEIILKLDEAPYGGIFTYILSGDDTTSFVISAMESFNSTDGANGDWVSLDTNLPGDEFGPDNRLRSINISNSSNERWFKFSITNNDIVDQSISTCGLRKFREYGNDYWVFTGASIEVASIDYSIMNPVIKSLYGYDPVIFNRAESGKTMSWLEENIDSILEAHPMAKFIPIHMGGNDVSNNRPYSITPTVTLDNFELNFRSIINKIQNLNMVAIPARISFRAYPNDPLDKPGTYNGGMPENGSLPFNREIIDPVIRDMVPDFYHEDSLWGVVDLYTGILNNQDALTTDGIHPSIEGRETFRDLWINTAFNVIYTGLKPEAFIAMEFNTPAEDALLLLEIAEVSREPYDILQAQNKINDLVDWPSFDAERVEYQNRLDLVTPLSVNNYWIDFGSSSFISSPNWNNFSNYTTGETINNLISDIGVTSDIDASLATGFSGLSLTGLNFEDIIYSAVRDSFTVRAYIGIDSVIELTSLNLNKKYSLNFYSTADNTSGYITDFTINGEKKSVLSSGNINQIISFQDITPDTLGKIIINIGTDTSYGYINAMSIRETDVEPTCSDGIQNQDETGVDVGGVCGYSFNLIYSAGTNGSLTGDTSQTVNEGENGTAVTAIPDSGYHFVDWSDGLTSNPRTDLNVVENISVMANFEVDSCLDGIQNQDETDVDVGGACSSQTYLIDFGTVTYLPPSNWNSITTYQDGLISDIYDTNNTPSIIDVSVIDRFTSSGSSGINTTTGIYPQNVIIDYFYVSTTDSPAMIKISDLDSQYTYDFTFFGSRTGTTATYMTDYTINSTTVTLDNKNNTSNTVTISGVSPDINNEIIINISASSGSSYGYLGGLEITKN